MIIQLNIEGKDDIIQWIQNNSMNHNKDDILKTALSIGLQSIQISETSYESKSYLQPIQDIANSTKDVIDGLDSKMNDIFHFKSNSSSKGQLGEIIAHKALMKKYPNWDIIDTSSQNYSGDLHAKNTPIGDILYEIKNYDYTINKDQITKFYRDLDNTGYKYGIFISYTSGIVGKKNIEWEIKDNKLLVYISTLGLNEYSIELATELLLALVTMDILNTDKNCMVDYNINFESIIDTLNEDLLLLKESVEYSHNHRQLIIEQTKKINEQLSIIEKSSNKHSLQLDYIFHKMISFCKEIDKNPTNIKTQTDEEINLFLDSLDGKNKIYFTELSKLCFTHSIGIMMKDKEWFFKKENTIVARTKSTKSKIELIIPIVTSSITLNMEYESMKHKELIIL